MKKHILTSLIIVLGTTGLFAQSKTTTDTIAIKNNIRFIFKELAEAGENAVLTDSMANYLQRYVGIVMKMYPTTTTDVELVQDVSYTPKHPFTDVIDVEHQIK